jgi:hypothetical protein
VGRAVGVPLSVKKLMLAPARLTHRAGSGRGRLGPARVATTWRLKFAAPAQWKSGETFALLQEFNEKCVKFHMKTQFEKHSHNSKCPHFGKTEHSILHLAVINITRI